MGNILRHAILVDRTVIARWGEPQIFLQLRPAPMTEMGRQV